MRPVQAVRGQPHDRSSKRSAAEAVEEAQEAGEALLDKGGKEPAAEPSGAGKVEPAGPGRPVEAGARLVVDPGAATLVIVGSAGLVGYAGASALLLATQEEKATAQTQKDTICACF